MSPVIINPPSLSKLLYAFPICAVKVISVSFSTLTLKTSFKSAEKRLSEIAVLKKHIINYSKTKDIYVGYRKSGYSKRYLAEHEADILIHKATKKAFDELKLDKLPSVKRLNSEYAELLSAKKLIMPSMSNCKRKSERCCCTSRIMNISSALKRTKTKKTTALAINIEKKHRPGCGSKMNSLFLGFWELSPTSKNRKSAVGGIFYLRTLYTQRQCLQKLYRIQYNFCYTETLGVPDMSII